MSESSAVIMSSLHVSKEKRVIKKKSSGERMDREIAIMKMLRHPNVVVVRACAANTHPLLSPRYAEIWDD